MSLSISRAHKVAFAFSLVVLSQIAGFASAGCGGGIGGGGFHRPPARAYGPSRIHSAAPSYRPVTHQQYQPAPQYHAAPRPAIRVVQTRPVSQPVQQQPIQQQRQPIQQQPVQQPIAQRPAAPQPTAPAPAQQQPTQNVQQNATLSALAFLANDVAPQQEQNVAGHVGTWKATTASGATVTLNLNNDGQFSWVAENNGKTSQFGGRFTLDNGTLTLSRSADNQKLAGKMTFSANGFNFLLNGAKDGGLNFQQS